MTGNETTIETTLTSLSDGVARLSTATDLRTHTQAIASMLSAVRGLGRSASGQTTAKSAILEYLVTCVGTAVTGIELEAVSGISDYGRRIRELRAEGWRIVGGATGPNSHERRLMAQVGITEMEPNTYVLLSASRKRVTRRPAAALPLAA